MAGTRTIRSNIHLYHEPQKDRTKRVEKNIRRINGLNFPNCMKLKEINPKKHTNTFHN